MYLLSTIMSNEQIYKIITCVTGVISVKICEKRLLQVQLTATIAINFSSTIAEVCVPEPISLPSLHLNTTNVTVFVFQI